MQKKQIRIRIGAAVAAVLGLLVTSCTGDVLVTESTTFDNYSWDMHEPLTVTWAPEDTSTLAVMWLYLRHTDQYPYNNIYLFRSISSSQGVEYQDTVNVRLADPLGSWIGSGMSNLKTVEIPVGRGAVQFTNQERYTITVTHGMRDTALAGIREVGFTLEAVEPQPQ